jgi:phosphoserine phosphatase RsbU/P
MVLNALRRSIDGRVFHELALFVAEDRNQYERELLAARKRAEELLVQQRAVELALKESQAELHRQKLTAEDRALFAEQMVGIVSHDLRNPLSAIQLSALLLARGALAPQQQKAVERIRNSSERAQRLIADLLDFTVVKIGRGLTMTLAPIDLHKLVADAADELRLTFADRALEHHRVGEGACRADADRLTQAIGNLVANAMTYGVADRTVTIASRIDADAFTVEVHNEGHPIDPARIAGLFDPMTRGVGARNSGRSVGLGLFVVREIARAHGGEVAGTSTAEDGTTFSIRLPR